MGFVEKRDTEGVGRGGVDEEESSEEDWAPARREHKRMERNARWNTDADILEEAVVAVDNVVEGKGKRSGG